MLLLPDLLLCVPDGIVEEDEENMAHRATKGLLFRMMFIQSCLVIS